MKKLLSMLIACGLALTMTLSFAACDPRGNGGTPSDDTPPATQEPDDGSDNNQKPDEGDDEKPEENPMTIVLNQNLNYTESTATIYNPDQGFYVPVNVTVTDTGITYNQSVIAGSTQVFHLRCDISLFSDNRYGGGGTSKPLTQAALDGIDELLSSLRNKNKNAIVRFCYDNNFAGNVTDGENHAIAIEPELDVMLNHAAQFCPIVDKYAATVTALEVGMVGPWGEMHTTPAANAATISALIGAFLQHTESVPVSVRTPQMIYNYLGIPSGAPANYKVPESAYRLGMFNDGYLGSESDLGTYSNREKDVAFISGQTAHLPYGGEVVTPSSTLHDIEVCLTEMYQIHLSYLNIQWNYNVVDKWKASTVTKDCADANPLYYGKTAFDYIQNHMGYRFVLKNSTFKCTENYDKLNVSLTLENVGFGNLNKTKKAKLLFVDKNNEVAFERDVEDFKGENKVEYTLPIDLKSGKYTVYLRLYGDVLNNGDTALYPIQFANDGLYSALWRANKIGELTIA